MAKKSYIWLILIFGLGLRLINLNQSFWLDEASQAQHSVLTVQQIWSDRPGDFHPPLFYLLAHFWLTVNTTETWARLLPVALGVITIWGVYQLAKSLWPDKPHLATIAALLLAVNPYHVYYSQEFRMYSLLALLGTLSMYGLVNKKPWLFVVNAALFYTHYSSFLLVAAQAVYVIAFAKKQLAWFIRQTAVTLALYLPWIPLFKMQLVSGANIDEFLPGWRQVLTVPTLKSLPLIIFKFVAGRINLLPKITYGIYIIFVLAATGLGVVLAKKNRSFLWTWLFVPIVLSIFLSFLVPQTQPFRLIFTLPALVLILAQAVARFPRLFMTILVYIAIVGNVLYFTRPRLQREQWRQAIGFLNSQQGSIVVKFSDKFAPFSWYSPQTPVIGAVKKYPAVAVDVSHELANASLQDNVYLLEYLTDLSDPQRTVESSLKELGFKSQEAYNFEGVGIISHYVKKLPTE